MTGQEVDTGIIPCIIVVCGRIVAAVKVAGAGNAPGCIPGLPAVALQKAAKRITVAPIPFGPAVVGGEAADLIQSAGIPCLGNKLDVAKDGITGKCFQKRWIVHRRTVLIAAENGRKIKSKTIDAITDCPVAQTFQNHLLHDRVIAV